MEAASLYSKSQEPFKAFQCSTAPTLASSASSCLADEGAATPSVGTAQGPVVGCAATIATASATAATAAAAASADIAASRADLPRLLLLLLTEVSPDHKQQLHLHATSMPSRTALELGIGPQWQAT